MFQSSNHREFQKGLDADKHRAHRYNDTLSLRRKQREAHLQKRRRELTNKSGGIGENSSFCNYRDVQMNEKEEHIPQYINMIMSVSSTVQQQIFGVTAIRKLLARERHPPTTKILNCGAVPKIISFMSSDSYDNNGTLDDKITKLKFESAWVVTNIAASTSECTHRLCQYGAIEAFVNLLRNGGHQDLVEQAIWGLGNIAGDSDELRNKVLGTGILCDLINFIPTWSLSLQRNAIWAISNLSRRQNGSNHLFLNNVENLIKLISKILLEINDMNLLVDCLWTLVYISNIEHNDISNYFVQYEVIQNVISILEKEKAKYEISLQQNMETQNRNGPCLETVNIRKKALLAMNSKITSPSTRFIGNIATGSDELTQVILDNGFCDIVDPFINHYVPTIRRETMWIISNILAGSHTQIEYVLSRENIIKQIINAINTDTLSVKREATWCICNASAEATLPQRKRLISYGAVEALCQLLNNRALCEKDQNVKIILEGLESFLEIYQSSSHNPVCIQIEECQGLDHIERINSDDNIGEDLFDFMQNIIKKYWPDDDMNNSNNHNKYVFQDTLTADIDTDTNQFQFGYNNNDNNNGANNNGGTYSF